MTEFRGCQTARKRFWWVHLFIWLRRAVTATTQTLHLPRPSHSKSHSLFAADKQANRCLYQLQWNKQVVGSAELETSSPLTGGSPQGSLKQPSLSHRAKVPWLRNTTRLNRLPNSTAWRIRTAEPLTRPVWKRRTTPAATPSTPDHPRGACIVDGGRANLPPLAFPFRDVERCFSAGVGCPRVCFLLDLLQ